MQELGAYSVDFMRVAPKLLMKTPNLSLSEIINFAATQTLSNKQEFEALQQQRESMKNGSK